MKVKVLLAALAVATLANAKDIKTVVLNTAPEMHCSSCENKIKSNIKFEKGIKDIETNLENKTVTIKYDADKTDVDKIIAGFKKIDYVATVAGAKTEAAPAVKKQGGCGCGCGCGQRKAAAAPVAANGSVVKYKATQIKCGGCANKVKTLLKGVDGVQDVNVDIETKIVTVNYDAKKTDTAKIKDSFKQINYNVEDVN